MARDGASWESRALPGSPAGKEYHRFEVMKAFETESSHVIPWFGQRGLGKQFRIEKREYKDGAYELLKKGFLDEK